MTMNHDRDDPALEDLFANARSPAADPSSDLLARVLGDARQVQAGFGPVGSADGAGPGLWAALLAAIGGWPALGGVATAGVAGLWLGLSPPAQVEDGLTGVLALSGWSPQETLFLDNGTDALGWLGLDALEEG